MRIYAAAAGKVIEVHDGEEDRNTGEDAFPPPPNYVKIDHGNGWITSYYHLRRNSAAVSVGDVVYGHQTIGLVGSSGNSTDSHLHFAVYNKGVPVETYLDPSNYWITVLPYSGDAPGVLDFGTTNHSPPTTELKERPIEHATFNPGDQVFFWVSAHGIKSGDTLAFRWFRPGGTECTSCGKSYTSGGLRYGWQLDDMLVPSGSGTWQVTFSRNGVELARDRFAVSTSANQVQFFAADYYVTENGGYAPIALVRTNGAGSVSFSFTTADSSATNGADYQETKGTVTFSSGELKKVVWVRILQNSSPESTEKVSLSFNNLTGGSSYGTPSSANLWIIDDDIAGQFQFDASGFSVNENAGQATIVVKRVGGNNGTVTVQYATGNGTASAGADYAAKSGVLTFNAGDTSKSFTVPILEDTTDENTETVNLTLSNPTGGASLGTPKTAVLSILDNDAAPSMSIKDVSVVEPDSGTIALLFTISLSAASGKTIVVNYATANNSAAAGSDYQAKTGSVSFNPGETQKYVSVLINGDTTPEPDETFFLNLSGVVNAILADAQGRGTIRNED